MDHSVDLVTRVRAAREAAQRAMDSFGDPSEYEITIIRGQKRDDTPRASQSPLDFGPSDPSEAD